MKVYALCDPDTRVVQHVGYAVNRDLDNLGRRAYGSVIKKWLDELPGPPLVVILADDPEGRLSTFHPWKRVKGTVLSDPPTVPKKRSRWTRT